MLSLVRAFLSVVAISGLLAPNVATLCAHQAERPCHQVSEHSCHNVPRLTHCNCGDAHNAVQAEPAQRAAGVAGVGDLVVLSPVRLVLPVVSSQVFHFDLAPPPATRERLSLLSILLV